MIYWHIDEHTIALIYNIKKKKTKGISERGKFIFDRP